MRGGKEFSFLFYLFIRGEEKEGKDSRRLKEKVPGTPTQNEGCQRVWESADSRSRRESTHYRCRSETGEVREREETPSWVLCLLPSTVGRVVVRRDVKGLQVQVV